MRSRDRPQVRKCVVTRSVEEEIARVDKAAYEEGHAAGFKEGRGGVAEEIAEALEAAGHSAAARIAREVGDAS